MKLKYSKARVWRTELEKKLKQEDCKTSEQVLDYLYGTSWNAYNHSYVVYPRWVETEEQSIGNRLNELWVVPLFILFVAPVRYVLFGRAGVDEDSKFGRILIYLLGVLK